MSDNPLSGHFRMPGIHQSLPSGGRYYGEGDINLAINGEVAIYPMTAGDEIILKNPDGLLNGHSIEKLIQSCVPDIKNVRDIPTADMDVLLLAIKLCSSGDELEVAAKCPKCKHENHYSMSIGYLLSQAKPLIESNEVRINDNLVASLRPYTFASTTRLNMAAFEETKMYQNLFNPEHSDQERQDQFNKSFEKIAYLNLELLSECIIRMTTSVDGKAVEVTERAHIREYVSNANKNDLKKIQDAMTAFQDAGLPKTMTAQCDQEECLHEWETEFNFDPSNFFG